MPPSKDAGKPPSGTSPPPTPYTFGQTAPALPKSPFNFGNFQAFDYSIDSFQSSGAGSSASAGIIALRTFVPPLDATALAKNACVTFGRSTPIATGMFSAVSTGGGVGAAGTPNETRHRSDENRDIVNPAKRMRDSKQLPPSKREKREYTNTTTIVVGREDIAKHFIVYKADICDGAPFFKAACSKEWIEGKTRKILIPRLDADYFHFYLNLVYDGHINEEDLDEHPSSCLNTEESITPECPASYSRVINITSIACRLSTMADFLGDSECKKACMEILLNTDDQPSSYDFTRLHPSTVEHIATNTTVNAGLFRWMVDEIARYLNSKGTKTDTLAEKLTKYPAVVKDALLEKTLVALRSGDIQDVAAIVNKYLD